MEKFSTQRVVPTTIANAFWQACRSRFPAWFPLFSVPFSAVGLILPPPATAQISCMQTPGTCTIEESQGGEGAQVQVEYTGEGGYTLENKATLGPAAPAIKVKIDGKSGSDDGDDGSNAGTVSIISSGQINAV